MKQETGTRLSILRTRLGYSQTEMAFYCGLSQSAYSLFEMGKRDMKASLIWDICDQFGCSSDWLLGRVADNGFIPSKPKYPTK